MFLSNAGRFALSYVHNQQISFGDALEHIPDGNPGGSLLEKVACYRIFETAVQNDAESVSVKVLMAKEAEAANEPCRQMGMETSCCEWGGRVPFLAVQIDAAVLVSICLEYKVLGGLRYEKVGIS